MLEAGDEDEATGRQGSSDGIIVQIYYVLYLQYLLNFICFKTGAGSSSRGRRGPTKSVPTHVVDRYSGQLECDLGQAAGPRAAEVFGTYCGAVARNYVQPIVGDWHTVSDDLKHTIWKVIQVRYCSI